MWSWLRKLINSLRETEQEHNGNLPPVSTTRQIQVKTKNIYPRERAGQPETNRARPEKQRKFRFPVIPDQPSIKKTGDAAARESGTFSIKEKAAVKPEEKRAYKPTEVISPIYGKIKPERQTYRTAPAKPPEERPKAEASFHQARTAEAEAAASLAEQAGHTQEETAASFNDRAEQLRAAAAAQPERTWLAPQGGGQTESAAKEADPAFTAGSADAQAVVERISADAEKAPLFPQADDRNRFVSAADWEAAPAEKQAAEQPVKLRSWTETETSELPAETLHTENRLPPSAGKAEAESAFGEEQQRTYEKPSLDLLNPSPPLTEDHYEYTLEQKQLLEETLNNFNVSAQVVGIVKGPSVTRFELQPAPGVKVNKITGLIDDIKLNMAAKDIRIEAPIPGRNAVGIEVPNLKSEPIFISRIIGSEKFRSHPSPLAIALGMDIGGEPIVADIKKMPHGLIAGSTGSGKSVCINSIIVSLLYKATPEQVRLLLIDPKMVELAPYNHLPHLVTPVVTDAKQATAALKWAVEEMEKRYALFVEAGVRDIDRYNMTTDEPLPYIVIIIDELADLMMVSPQDVEDCIIRIAQKARACGIHLLLATQRPSVDVITGNIKANVPTRLAFAVFSQVDSRTILDQSGAERLLGRGDMLFLESGAAPLRLQGNYVSDDEIERITQMIKKQRKPEYLFSKEELEQSMQSYDMGDDPLYHEALVFVAEQGQASASALQRRFRIGYNRAARLIEMMEAEGHVAGQSGGKPRAVLITREDAQALAEGTSLL
jgi:S-DNA-T family DNA segregation ATPase FtsK/SpoIIIE